MRSKKGFPNKEITVMNEEILALNQHLTALNKELEQRVAERTADLKAAHEELSAQYAEYRAAQEALWERETSYFDLVKNLTDGIVLRDDTGQIIYANQTFADMLQVDDPQAMEGIPYLEFVHPDDRAESVRRIAMHIKGQPTVWREHRLVGLQGRTIIVVSNSVLITRDGKPCLMGVLHDITERKLSEVKMLRSAQIQEVLREIAEKTALSISLNELFRTVHHLVGQVFPPDNFNISILHEAGRQMETPYCADETGNIPLQRPVGKYMTEYVMRQRKAMHVTSAEYERLLEAGEVDSRFVNFNEWMGAPLIDSQGKAFGAVTLLTLSNERSFNPEDIKFLSIIAAQLSIAIERKKAETELQSSRARYQALVEQSCEGLALVDIETREVVEINRRFSEMLGYSLPADSPLYNYQCVVDSQQNFDRYYNETLRQQRILPTELRIYRHKNGVEIPVERAGTVVRINDKDYLLVSLRDMTSERRRQAELARDAQMATRVQNAMISLPRPSEYLDVAAIYKPFSYVGGDLYFLDWRYGDSLLRGFLVDTTGHGLSTALHTASLHVLLREINEKDLPLSDAMRWLNRHAGDYFEEGIFAGALLFEIDLETRQLRWTCAGIPQIWIATKKQQGLLERPGMFLGIDEDETFDTHSMPITADDSFYFMSDGFSDRLGRRDDLPLGLYPDMVGLLRALSEGGELRDDATAICIKVRSLPQSTVRQDGWPRILRFNGYGDYQRFRGEVANILLEVTGVPHSFHEVAVNEALANALECRDGVPRQHRARLRFNKIGNRLIVRVKTSRIGFAGNSILRRLRSHPEEMFSFGEDASMGRGIPMMLAVSHKMMYNSEGTEVLLAWKLGSG